MTVAAVAIPTQADSPQALLATAVDALLAVAIDGLDEPAIHAELVADEQQIRRLQARTTSLAAALAQRQVARQRAARPDDPRAGQRANAQVQQR